MVASERTMWRDFRLSIRHRCWGFGCTCTDLDAMIPALNLGFVMLEYTKPSKQSGRAFIEYKHEQTKKPFIDGKSYQVLLEVAKNSIAVILAYYNHDFSRWRIMPLNQAAKSYLPEETIMNERAWVELLYTIHGIEQPRKFFDILFRNIEMSFEQRMKDLPDPAKTYITEMAQLMTE